jgi:hypothetical protein
MVPTGDIDVSILDEPSSGSNRSSAYFRTLNGSRTDDARFLLRGHRGEPAAMIHGLDDDLVRHDIELLLHLALDVFILRRAKNVHQTGAADLVGDHFRRKPEIVEDAGKLTRGFRVVPLFLDDETLDGDYRRRGMFDHADHP